MKFIICGPVASNEHPKEVYRLHVRVMHGDADHYENKQFDFPATYSDPIWTDWSVGLKEIVLAFQKFAKLDHNVQCKVLRDIRDFCKSVCPDESKASELGQLWWEVVGNDVTHDDVSARPQNFHITYFYNNGIEHTVEISEE